jgi:hypothetical protein
VLPVKATTFSGLAWMIDGMTEIPKAIKRCVAEKQSGRRPTQQRKADGREHCPGHHDA